MTDGVVAEIVRLLLLIPTLMIPAPETLNTLLKVPDELFVVFPTPDNETVLKFVTLGVVTEIVTLPAPTPTLAMPAPEKTKPVEKVPVELLVVLPEADIDTDAAAADGTEIVTESPLTPTLAIPAPEIFIRLENVPVLPSVVFPSAVMDCVIV